MRLTTPTRSACSSRVGRDCGAGADAPVVRDPAEAGRARRRARVGSFGVRRPPLVGVGRPIRGRRGGRGRRGAPSPSHPTVRCRRPVLAPCPGRRGSARHRTQVPRGGRGTRAAVAAALGTTLAGMPALVADRRDWRAACLDRSHSELAETTRCRDRWVHGEFWAAHLRAEAQRADQLVVASPPDRVMAMALLAVDPERIVTIPNGVDLDRFRPRALTLDERRACFRRWLVEEPHGWKEGGASGTVAYGDDDLVRLLGVDGDAVVLLYVGRFTSATARTHTHSRVRAGTGAIRAAGVARGVGWEPRRVRRRAPGDSRHTGRRRRDLLRGLARSRRSARRARSKRRVRHGVGERLVPASAARGDGRRTPGDRHHERGFSVDDQPQRGAPHPGGSWLPTTSTHSPTH